MILFNLLIWLGFKRRVKIFEVEKDRKDKIKSLGDYDSWGGNECFE